MTAVARRLETWRGMDPVAVACRSADELVPVLRDARHDVLLLARALQTLHTVCAGMDIEDQMQRPTEAQYQAAMKAAAALLPPPGVSL